MTRAAADAYKTQAIMTASPAKLVAMCYDRTILALNDAIRSIEAGDIQARCNHATRAAEIISHLWTTLDMEKGGEIAQNLSNIYGYAMGRMPEINLNNDAGAAREIVSVLEPLRQSWTELANKGESAGAAAAAAAAAAASARTAAAPPRAPTAPAPGPAQAGGGVAISI